MLDKIQIAVNKDHSAAKHTTLFTETKRKIFVTMLLQIRFSTTKTKKGHTQTHTDTHACMRAHHTARSVMGQEERTCTYFTITGNL